MSRIARAETSRISIATSCRLLLAIAGAASLAACAQSPVGRQKADLAYWKKMIEYTGVKVE